ncbi:hypothetical protein OnM2_084043 [Erysiphe neolycopersici]|uniref:Thioester reductase (TE) domain-containing protein n=1 Tax=Erysiphe neolycopersici TaxID=212602 RepID=A0A420HFF5_9PEZI|nr:hypothetical protein OnM2_084043 [Erysiphe neolycopersici]
MPEKDIPSFEPQHAFNLGYSQSKWVAEAVLTSLSKKYLTIATSILRVGQLSGDTIKGIWNPREAWPLMIDASLFSFSGVKLPDLASLMLPAIDWLPVDLAAKAICETIKIGTNKEVEFLQISNKNSRNHISWHQFQRWFSTWAEEKGIIFNIVESKIWLNELEEQQHKAKALIPLWRKNWQDDEAITNPLVVRNEIDDGILCAKYIWRLLDSIYERRNPEYY